MAFWAVTLAALVSSPAQIERDSYGVPLVTAGSFAATFEGFGEAVAEDRLWQMEMSRRVATGRSAEVLGATAVAADKETVRMGYSNQEYADMFRKLSPKAQTAFESYAKGVNATIERRTKDGTLPPQFAEHSLSPSPWTVQDSLAIEVMLARRFGTGGAGELRNLALYLYLKTQKCKDRVLDVVDDFAWQNDARSVPTVSPQDDPLARTHTKFAPTTRKDTEAHLAALPKVSLLELVPAIRAAVGDESKLIAESVGAPFETGSYCMVVSPNRSKTGRALLLTGPQMGFTSPSIVHEVALRCPGLQVAGIDVPGIPAVVIGATPRLAWGLTTGVADMSDIVAAKLSGSDSYQYGSQTKPLTREKLAVGGETVERVRSEIGPVVFESKSTKSVFIQRSAFWKQEAASWSCLYDLYSASDAKEVDRAVADIGMNLNLFFATTKGQTGWRYLGQMPKRAPGFDPRFPLPAGPESDWQGSLAREEMPRVDNPKAGLIANWNNKPASWWPNMDTPAWGRLFRNEILLQTLSASKLGPWDLEMAAWQVARKDTDTNSAFRPFFPAGSPAGRVLSSFDGWTLQDSAGGALYKEAVKQLRREVFEKHVGNFTSDSFFEQVAQPSVLLNALEGKTKYDYLAGKTATELAAKAADDALTILNKKYGEAQSLWQTTPPSMKFDAEPPVPYSNRGTYIQISELFEPPQCRSVAPPGVSESGAHKYDQVPLARQWTFKKMWPFES